MPILLTSEEDLRAALQPYRVDRATFEASVRQRLESVAREQSAPTLLRLSPWLRCAAALLPIQAMGSKAKYVNGQLAMGAGAYKAFAYVAFPAISFFVLLGATVFSLRKINAMRREAGSLTDDEQALHEGLLQWWRQHKWGAGVVYAGTLFLSLLGATWALFALYILSFVLLVYVLTSLAKLGLGNRQLVGQSCLVGLMLLGQLALIPSLASDGIRFVDSSVLGAVFFGGALLLIPAVIGSSSPIEWRLEKPSRWWYAAVLLQLLVAVVVWLFIHSLWITALVLGAALFTLVLTRYRSSAAGRTMTSARHWTVGAAFAMIVVPLIAWQLSPFLWPATPQRIKSYVESFHKAPFHTVSWRQWEIVARWAIDAKLDPNLSGAQRLLDQEIAGAQNPFVLSSAFRLGMVRPDQLSQLRDFANRRRGLLDGPRDLVATQRITSLDQKDWVIRAAVLGNNLSPAERDLLARRLLATLDALSSSPYDVLHSALLATQLLAAIDRPIDPVQYQARVHKWLLASHCTRGGGFEPAGGFKTYLNTPVAAVPATADAVALMEIYGVPEQLDLNWVRSYLRPQSYRLDDRKWIAAVTLDRLNRLPGVRPPSWFELFYYERSLLAATILVGLCLYATWSSPVLKVGN